LIRVISSISLLTCDSSFFQSTPLGVAPNWLIFSV
jgi:hypothetical protein